MNQITIGNATHTVIAESATNAGRLVITLDNGVVSKWVSRRDVEDGRLICVASGPIESHQKWDDDTTREAAIHRGAWWEDHKAQLMAMTYIALSRKGEAAETEIATLDHVESANTVVEEIEDC